MYNFSTFLIVTKSNAKLNIFIFFDKSFTNKFLLGIVKIKKGVSFHKLEHIVSHKSKNKGNT